MKRRACVACTLVKQKCIQHSANLCQRCARLGKDCVFLDVQQREQKQRGTRRVQELENRVNQLTVQLAHISKQGSTQFQSPPTVGSAPLTDPLSTISGNLAHFPNHLHSSLNPSNLSGVAGDEQDNANTIGLGGLSFDEAETSLQTFRQQFVPHFPFAAIAAGKDAFEIKKENPFLYTCIVAVALKPTHRLRQQLKKDAIDQATSGALSAADESLDLLRGLIVIAAWYYRFGLANRSHVEAIRVVQMCITTCYSLDLERKEGLTLDEQRALLGTYWLSKSIEKAFQKPIGLKYGKNVEDACENVTRLMDQVTDHHIRPHIVLQTYTSHISDTYSSLFTAKISSGVDGLVGVMRSSLLREWTEVKATLQRDYQEYHNSSTERLFILWSHFVDICVGEVAIQSSPWLDTCVERSSDPRRLQLKSSAERSSTLYQVMKSCKSYIAEFLNTPSTDLSYFTFLPYSHLCYTLITLAKSAFAMLETISDDLELASEALDYSQRLEVETVLKEADFVGSLEAVLQKLEYMARDVSPEDKDKDMFVLFISKLRHFRHSYFLRVNRLITVGNGSTGADGQAGFVGGRNNATIDPPSGAREGQGWPLSFTADNDISLMEDLTLWNSFGNYDWYV